MGRRASSFRLTQCESDSRPTATGYCAAHLPAGPQSDEIIDLLRTGVAIQAQWIGRRPGPLARLVRRLAGEHKGMSFEQLLTWLHVESQKREHLGESASCVESVNRAWQLVTYHNDAKIRVQVGFAHVGNLLSAARKEIHGSP